MTVFGGFFDPFVEFLLYFGRDRTVMVGGLAVLGVGAADVCAFDEEDDEGVDVLFCCVRCVLDRRKARIRFFWGVENAFCRSSVFRHRRGDGVRGRRFFCRCVCFRQEAVQRLVIGPSGKNEGKQEGNEQ